MRRALAALTALAMAGNGIVMLAAGRWWYGAVPGVTGTGPFNGHFVKDIGAAYLVAGAGFAWLAAAPVAAAQGAAVRGAAVRGAAARGAAMAGAAFLALHALIHLVEAVGNPAGLADLARDFPGVILPALTALFLAGPAAPKSET